MPGVTVDNANAMCLVVIVSCHMFIGYLISTWSSPTFIVTFLDPGADGEPEHV